jgi:hypothetical protein
MCANLTERNSIIRKKTIFLDQGQEGACTGFGEENVRALTPYPQTTSNRQAFKIYERARFLDEYPGEDYEGSSVNGAMKAAREAGFVKGWRWAKTGPEIRHGLSYHGAGEAGTWWYEGMYETDVDGFVHPTGKKVGGHAYAIAGFNWLNGFLRYRIENSWGADWGDNGGAWIWEYDLLPLIDDFGEMAFPQKVRL